MSGVGAVHINAPRTATKRPRAVPKKKAHVVSDAKTVVSGLDILFFQFRYATKFVIGPLLNHSRKQTLAVLLHRHDSAHCGYSAALPSLEKRSCPYEPSSARMAGGERPTRTGATNVLP